MQCPRTGNRFTSQSSDAISLYLEAIDLILGSETGARVKLDQALQLDPEFAMATVARYMLAKDAGESDAEALKTRAQMLADSAQPWERDHIDILVGLLLDPYANLTRTEEYVASCPGDLLIISQLCGYLIFYGGPHKLTRVLSILKGSERQLSEDWAFLARLGFASSEAGDPVAGRIIQERALEMRPQALYSIHGYAHILHDLGVPRESAEMIHTWLDEHRRSAEGGALYGHLQWHLALAEWQVGERDIAWARYQQHCSPENTTCGPVLTLADCGGFLLRDFLEYGDRSLATKAVKALTEKFDGMLGHPFIALHIAGIHAATGDLAGLSRCQALIQTKELTDNRVLAEQLVEAISFFTRSEYNKASEILNQITPAQRIGVGGSYVERMLIDLLESRANALAA